MSTLSVVSAGVVPYDVATRWQQELHARRVADEMSDVLLLLEHPHVYTLGRRFAPEHLLVDQAELARRGIALHEADRGGSVTYHGPGQLVGYPIVDLAGAPNPARRATGEPDTIRYLRLLEEALIRAVGSLGVAATRREGLTGVWAGASKLASIGVNVSRGVTRHGFALNVSTDLAFFQGMIPCGIGDARMTSLAELLGDGVAMGEVAATVAGEVAALLERRPVPCTLADLGLHADGLPGGEAWPSAVVPQTPHSAILGR